MATTVAQARTALNLLMRYGNQNFTDTQRDYAIFWAMAQATRATGILRTIGTITTADDDAILTHSLTRFEPGRRYAPAYIAGTDYARVTARAYGDIQAALDASTTKGKPEMIAFVTATQAAIYPIADAEYSIMVPYEQTAQTWTYGDAGATTLELPDHIVLGGMLFGAKAYLMSGLEDGRAEEDRATARFNAWLEEIADADIDLAPTTQPRQAQYGQTYTPLPGS